MHACSEDQLTLGFIQRSQRGFSDFSAAGVGNPVAEAGGRRLAPPFSASTRGIRLVHRYFRDPTRTREAGGLAALSSLFKSCPRITCLYSCPP